ncbi:hypothetical protein MMC2321_02819 [Chitinophaga sp. MM2321]
MITSIAQQSCCKRINEITSGEVYDEIIRTMENMVHCLSVKPREDFITLRSFSYPENRKNLTSNQVSLNYMLKIQGIPCFQLYS